ncbi:alpha/beta hydrolase [Alteromonas sp. ASW11-130]|uniref:alpha/beta hydrolase n=1 Tax=Alteromonas sp. ASW11-130 TaxID=3015775 RepID=UPI002242A0F8|nr:alpha/beta hydrolase [Alteromonas sp. ASW11-130]MCW8090759.1 alpha/beta hydrolase [Alteromonas sp. ASW11-130]
MLIITNRNINFQNFNNGVGNENGFGDHVNAKGPNEIRLAHAERDGEHWKVSLVNEPNNLKASNLPSRRIFDQIRDRLIETRRNALFFVHGFNQSFVKNLEKAQRIEDLHGVEVIVFSWPSNPGGFPTSEYRQARRHAQASVSALDATLEKLGQYLKEPFSKQELQRCGVKLSFMAYSLGNFLFQSYVSGTSYDDETNVFENIILCQADVDNEGHRLWVDKIQAGKRVYVTINENDYVLKWSDTNFQKDRLGRSATKLNARAAIYFDFTNGAKVERTHEMFAVRENESVRSFFTEVLNGRRAERNTSMKFDDRINCYRF